MFVDEEKLMPGEIYEHQGEEVVFEGAGLEPMTLGESLVVRSLDNGRLKFLREPEFKKSGRSSEEFWKQEAEALRGNRRGLDSFLRGVVLGGDPEFFMEFGGRLVPAFDVFKSKKENPSLFWDGFQGEFTIPTATCVEVFTWWVRDKLQEALRITEERICGKVDRFTPLGERAFRSRFYAGSVVAVDRKMLEASKDEHVALGCSPSKNIYLGLRGMVVDPRALPMRFAGGHLHIGFEHRYFNERMKVEAVRCMDMLAGIPSVILAENWDQVARRQFYGQAGEFRTPKHGLEYRTLSNFWLSEPAVCQLVVGLVRGAFNWGMNGWRMLLDGSERETVEIIQSGDVKGAREWVRRNREMFGRFLSFARIPDQELTIQILLGEVKFVMDREFRRWKFFKERTPETWSGRMSAIRDEIV